MNKKKINTIVGSIGAFIGVFVFISYIPQIIANISGNKSQPLQPLIAAISCLIWVIYGLTKEPKKEYKALPTRNLQHYENIALLLCLRNKIPSTEIRHLRRSTSGYYSIIFVF